RRRDDRPDAVLRAQAPAEVVHLLLLGLRELPVRTQHQADERAEHELLLVVEVVELHRVVDTLTARGLQSEWYGSDMRRIHRIAPLFALALLLAATAVPSIAQAGGRHRPTYAGFGGGPYWFLDENSWAHAHLSGEVGFHFNGEDRGFFLQIEVQTTFSENRWFQFVGGLRLGGDIEITGNYHAGFMLRPNVFFGLGAGDLPGPNNTYGIGVIEPTCDLRFAVADRLLAI